MTVQEFSNEFDVLINSYFVTGNYQISTPVDLDDYEKSVLLTKAQNDIVKQLYNGSLGVPFEGTQEIRRYLDSLIHTRTLKVFGGRTLKNRKVYEVNLMINDLGGTIANNVNYDKDRLFIVYETACLNDTCNKEDKEVTVVPVRYDELNRILDNPFRTANSNRVLRVDRGKSSIYLVPPIDKNGKTATISSYTVTYIQKPSPIILTSLKNSGLSIDGQTSQQTCELDSSLHRTILEAAVRLALNKIENSTPKTQEE